MRSTSSKKAHAAGGDVAPSKQKAALLPFRHRSLPCLPQLGLLPPPLLEPGHRSWARALVGVGGAVCCPVVSEVVVGGVEA